jgi:hypothetical protein
VVRISGKTTTWSLFHMLAKKKYYMDLNSCKFNKNTENGNKISGSFCQVLVKILGKSMKV